MRDVGYSNKKILKMYEDSILNESTKGFRRKVQVLEDKIDDFMDDLEKIIDKEEENPTFKQKMYQLLANTTKEQSEHIAALKRLAMAVDSGAKVIPQERGQMNFKPNAPNVVNQQPPEENPQGPQAPASGDQESQPLAENVEPWEIIDMLNKTKKKILYSSPMTKKDIKKSVKLLNDVIAMLEKVNVF